MDFVLNGESFSMVRSQVEVALADVAPEPLRKHGVRVGGVVYPVKQAFALATGVPRTNFQSQTARRLLARLGFDVVGEASPRSPQGGVTVDPSRRATAQASEHDPSAWPWEGQIQSLFADYLRVNGWLVTAMADTATKARGVDVLAHKGSRNLGAEVKGWPSKVYADPRRGAETKPTQPTSQAGHWFSQALFKGLMLLDSHPGHESLVVLPDYPRYRDLARRTKSGRAAVGVHVVFMAEDGRAMSETWTA